MLPGALVTALITPDAERILFPSVFPQYPGEGAGWAMFLFASYLFGNFIFLIGSRLDSVYDKIREATEEVEARQLAEGRQPSSQLSRWLAKKIFSKNPDVAITEILKLKQKYIPDVDKKPIINAFQWAKARLTLQCPTALLEVQRFEADSKFFRSLVVVLMFLAVWLSLSSQQWLIILLSLLLTCLSFWRYSERRFKATQQAYWYILTMEHTLPNEAKVSSDVAE